MKISELLDHIDSGAIALPEFQRGYVWSRDQVRGLMTSLYQRHPVGSLLIWSTTAGTAPSRGGDVGEGVVKLLLDGQQRLTSLYGVARGKPPRFFDGNAHAFTGLRFNLSSAEFEFYGPVKMDGDPLWIDVSEMLKAGAASTSLVYNQLLAAGHDPAGLGQYLANLNQLLGILDINLHAEEITGADKGIDTVVEIFNKVNSGGTKLSKGDLALAKICAGWPEARDRMKEKLGEWSGHGYKFDLDWLLRNVNTVLTGEARFQKLHNIPSERIKDGLARAERAVDDVLNMIAGRLGLDHDRVLLGRYAIPVLSHLQDRSGGLTAQADIDRALFWYVQAGMWGRFSGQTESMLDRDLAAIENTKAPLNKLVEQLRIWRGSLRVEPENFDAHSLGSRFYPVLYMLTRMTGGRDLLTGLPLKANMLGKMSRLEVHHIFPKSLLYHEGYNRAEVNAVANFCLLTKDSNLRILNDHPPKYLGALEAENPGVLASQWIPEDPALWELPRYPEFLQTRRALLSDAANAMLADLLHGEIALMGHSREAVAATAPVHAAPVGGIASEDEEQELHLLNDWVEANGFGRGEILYELVNEETGMPEALLDLAWPVGLQAHLSQPVAVLIDEPAELLHRASRHGFECFTSPGELKAHVKALISNDQRGKEA